MKQKIYILGIVTVLLIFAGTIFKVNHLPGAGKMLSIGIFTLVIIFLPVALINNYRTEGNKRNALMYVITWITCLVMFTAMLFKIMHWPGAGTLLLISLPFPFIVFLPVYLIITSKIENYNIYNTVFILFLLASISVFSALLALSVSKNRIDDSLVLADQYNSYEKSITKLTGADSLYKSVEKHPSLISKIDETLAFVNECQNNILRKTGTTEAEWTTDPVLSRYLDSRQAAGVVMLQSQDPAPADRLGADLKSIVSELEQMPECEDLAKLAPLLFEIREFDDNDIQWSEGIFAGNYLSWALVYLDALEVNLHNIKSSLAMCK
jgi:hypothetical protein